MRVAADGQSARALDVQHRRGLLQRGAQAFADHLEGAREIDDLIDLAVLAFAGARQLRESVAGAGYVLANPADELFARGRLPFVRELFDEQGEVVQGVLDVVRHRRGDHPDRLPAFRSRQPFRQDLRGSLLGGMEPAGAVGIEKRARQEHPGERRSNPVDDEDQPVTYPLLDAGGGEDVVHAGEEKPDEEPNDDDQGSGAGSAPHPDSVPEELSHLLQNCRRFWNRSTRLYC